MFWQALASSAAFAIGALPSRVVSAPLAQLGALTGDNGPPPGAYAYHSCPNGGTWSRLEDDFTTFRSSDWIIETGARGVSTGPDGMTLDLSKDMVSFLRKFDNDRLVELITFCHRPTLAVSSLQLAHSQSNHQSSA